MASSENDQEYENKLLIYYQRMFPFDLLHQWLSYGKDRLFQCREFAFWFLAPRGAGSAGSDSFFLRYQCYTTLEEFKKALSTRQTFGSGVVERMEIGPIYKSPPSTRGQGGCFPDTREFVIDIDMDDYNSVRNCCQGAQVCSFCWIVMSIAVKVIDRALRTEFGFKHLLWVFSGRRGVHCWVSDDSARRLSREERKTIIDFMSVDRHAIHLGLTNPLFPYFERAYSDLKRLFESRMLVEQDLLHTQKTTDHILNMLPEAIAETLRKRWDDEPHQSSANRWTQLVKTLEKQPNGKVLIASIVFDFTYPRFDAKVSEDLNHLLKSPFCVHPKTGFVSIPIDPNFCERFDPTQHVPSLSGLIRDLDNGEGNDQLLLKAAHEFFEKKFLQPLKNSRRAASGDIEDL